MQVRIPVTWEMCGMVTVEANTLPEAIEEFRRIQDDLELPKESGYVDGSFDMATDDMSILRGYNPKVLKK